MAKAARKAEVKREQPEENTYSARLLGIVDMGHQPGFSDGSNSYDSKWKYEFTYELVTTQMEDGRPFVISETMNNNNWEDAKTGRTTTLVSRAKSLIGKDYHRALEEDITSLLGKPCMVTVTYNKSGYASIKGASAEGSVPVGFTVPELQNKTYFFDMCDLDDTEEPDMALYETMPDFKKERLQEALNFNETKLARILAEGDEFK